MSGQPGSEAPLVESGDREGGEAIISADFTAHPPENLLLLLKSPNILIRLPHLSVDNSAPRSLSRTSRRFFVPTLGRHK